MSSMYMNTFFCCICPGVKLTSHRECINTNLNDSGQNLSTVGTHQQWLRAPGTSDMPIPSLFDFSQSGRYFVAWYCSIIFTSGIVSEVELFSTCY